MSHTGLRLRTAGPDDTRALAAATAAVFEAGDVIALSGELGAGKTCFVQGVARALEVPGRVTSPTFMLVRRYEGRLSVVHCDVYRLDRYQDVYDLGDEVMAPDVVTFIEWGDAVAALLPDDRLEVELRLTDDDDDERLIDLRPHGSWVDRLAGLAGPLDPWRCDHREPPC